MGNTISDNGRGYLSNRKLRKAGQVLALSKEELKEYIKCSENPIYFIERYTKILTIDGGLVNIKLWKFQKEIVKTCYENNRIALNAARQIGKALALDTKIPTPTGFTTMGNLRVGDTVLDKNGNPTKVTFVTETMYDHDCYEIEFDSGHKVIADMDHVWQTNDGVFTTQELFDLLPRKKSRGQGIGIEYNPCVKYSEKELPIDPYLFGLWLGDGSKCSGVISCHREDYKIYSMNLISEKISEFRLDKRTENTGSFNVYNMLPVLRKLNVYRNKHIPEIYKKSSVEQRLELLRGLMDSDGYVMKTGNCSFSQKNMNIINDVREIFASLGVKTRINSKIIAGETYYNLNCTTNKYEIFKLPRKIERQKLLQGNYQLKNIYIKSINKTTSVPVRCIQVNNPDHLFLCSDGFIPTHNTSTVAVGFLMWYAIFNPDKVIAILAQKEQTAIEILSRIKMAYQNLPLWLQQGIVEWNKASIEMENLSKIISSSTSSNAIRGFSIACVDGDSKIDIRIDGDIKLSLTIKELEYLLANSSKYNRIDKDGGYYYVLEQQIHENLFSFDGKKLPVKYNDGNTSYNSEIYGWDKYTHKSETPSNKSTPISTPITNKNGTVSDSQTINDICTSYNAYGEARNIVEIDRRTEDEIFETYFSIYEHEREKTFRGIKKENVSIKKGDSTFKGTFSEYISGIKGKEENARTHGKDKQESYKNTENGRETSWYEKIAGSQSENVSGGERQNSLEQRIEILTEEGYNEFSGLSITHNKSVIKITTKNHELICTSDHKIYSENEWQDAASLLNKEILTVSGWEKVESIVSQTNSVSVYDILGVNHTNSFIANGILVHNCLYLDEFAFVPNNIADDFLTSVYPTISSGKTSKIIISSTPHGMNHWYKICTDAKNKKNQFKLLEYDWTAVPTRDKKWEKDQRQVLGEEKFQQEHMIEFMGSAGTLISGKALRNLAYVDPIKLLMDNKLKIYEAPKPGTQYVITVDSSYGKELDYSTFTVFDVSATPYRSVASYRNNDISPQQYPSLISTVGNWYNKAFILCENNDIGSLVLQILQNDLEYPNLFFTKDDSKKGAALSFFGGDTLGLRVSPKVKRLATSALKTIIETNLLLVNDFETISELATFVVKKNKTYAADDGYNDDTVTNLYLFAWLTTQPIFKDLVDVDLRKKLFDNYTKELEQEMPPVPVRIESSPKANQFIRDGIVWTEVLSDEDAAAGDGRYSGYPDRNGYLY